MKRRGAYISIAIAAVVIALLVVQISSKQWKKDENLNVTAKALPVTIASVVQYEFADEISAVGTLKARDMSPLSPKVAGTVNRVLVDIGERVKAGEVVIKLDRTNYDLGVKQAQAALAAAEAAVPQAEAQFEQAEKEFRRATELLEEKVIPQSRFDSAEAAFKSAREAVSYAKAQRDRAKAALETALEHLKDADIRSPINGTVVERNVEIGQAVAPGGRLLRIVDQTSLNLDVDLPETDIGRLTVGTVALITTDAFPGHEYSGKVTVVNPRVDRGTRTFRTRIEVPNPSGKLVDGMYARVKFSVEKRRSLAVPRDALQRLPGSGTYYVFVVEGNMAHKRTVEISAMDVNMSDNSSGFPKNIGLALGSGSARGWSHIGVLRALAEAEIKIRYVAGTSIGSLVGAACALNKMDVLEDFARQLDWKQIVSFLDVTFPRSGLIDGKKISDFFRSHVREMNIEELPLRYCAVATDLATGREVVLNKGDLIEAIRASISVPGIFTPVKKKGRFLVDGGLVNPVPVSAVRKMGADYVIAVDLNHDIIDKRSAAGIASVDSSVAGVVVQPRPPKWRIAQELGNRFNEFSSPALSQ
ncbi:MAG: efflux RND transporter periplasmic adaptor subunit, partial [Deltaproteobacteria bacterium]|nr:efflux RND transporter periplasmic adaptor subunit [Deltaproteobacteria bacterium]